MTRDTRIALFLIWELSVLAVRARRVRNVSP